jgi:hypothetical protein
MAEQTQVFRDCARTTPSSLQLRRHIGFDDWRGLGRQIARLSNASAWWLGDWLVYGQRAYGKRYRAALEATQLDYQTLRNYAWVARSFDAARRRENLSFQHHAEVAALHEAEQDLWLERAERMRWSRNRLRRQLAIERREGGRPAGDESAAILRLRVPAGREQRWRDAAIAAEQDLVDWIASAADNAADVALNASSGHPRVEANRRARAANASVRNYRRSSMS